METEPHKITTDEKRAAEARWLDRQVLPSESDPQCKNCGFAWHILDPSRHEAHLESGHCYMFSERPEGHCAQQDPVGQNR